LTAVLKKKLMGDYKHPVWLSVAGWIVVVIMGIMGGKAIAALIL
jgi:Mn2+/Fe2+ NRAMP family transporter